ncbi:hypothetical protein OnM2_020056, partial [Erysiphe neolycopersici]
MAHRHHRRLQEPAFDHSTPPVESQPQHIPPVAMSESEDYRTRSKHRYQKDPAIKQQHQLYPYSPSRLSDDSSSNSSGSYIEISRNNQERLAGLSDFFSAPFENANRVKAKLRKKKSRKSFFRFGSNTSSSSVNSDLAYGTGFIRIPKKKGKGQAAQKTIRDSDRSREKFEEDSDHEAYTESIHALHNESSSERSTESDKKRQQRKEKSHRSKKSLRPPKKHVSNISTTTEILAIGTGLAKLAKSDNRVSLQNTRKSNYRNQENKSQSSLKTVPPKTFYSSGDDDDDDGWESTYDSESESSIDSKLAYGSESETGWSLFGSKRPRNNSNHQSSSKYSKTDGIRNKEEESRGPINTTREVSYSKSKYDNDKYISHIRPDNIKKFQQGPLIMTGSEKDSRIIATPSEPLITTSTGNASSNHGVSQVHKSDPLFSTRSKNVPLQIIQPQPITPVSQSIYEADKRPQKNNTYESGNYKPHRQSFPTMVDGNYDNKAIGIASKQNISLAEGKRGETSDVVKEDRHQNWEREDLQEEIRRRETAIIQLQRERLALRKEMQSREKNPDQIKLHTELDADPFRKKKNKDIGRKRELDQEEKKGNIQDISRLNKKRDTGWEKIMDPFLYQVFDSSSDEPQTSPRIAMNSSLEYYQFDHQTSAQQSISSKSDQTLPSSKLYSETTRNNFNDDDDLGNKTSRKEIRYDPQLNSKVANTTTHIEGEFPAAVLERNRESRSDKQIDERRQFDQDNAYNFNFSKSTEKISGVQNENPQNYRGKSTLGGIFVNENNTNIHPNFQLPIRNVPHIFGDKGEIPKVGTFTLSESENFHQKMMPLRSSYAPDAGFRLDYVMNHPNEIQNLNTISRSAQHDPHMLDIEAAPLRPFINLISPTPSPPLRSEGYEASSESVLLSEDRKNNQSLQSNLVTESKVQPKNSSQLPNTPKSVSWGVNETKHYDTGFPSQNDDKNISKYEFLSGKFPESHSNIYFPISNTRNTSEEVKESVQGAPKESHSNEYTNSFVKSSSNPSNYWLGEEKEQKANNSLYYPQPFVESSTSSSNLKSQTSHAPRTLEEDLGFTATVAAGLEKTGFDPEIIISDTDFRHNNSSHNLPEFRVDKHAIYANTMSDFETEIPRSEERELITKEYQKPDFYTKFEGPEKNVSSNPDKIILSENFKYDGNDEKNGHNSSSLSKNAKSRNIKKKRNNSGKMKGNVPADIIHCEGIIGGNDIDNHKTQELSKERLNNIFKENSQEITRIDPPQQSLQLDNPDDIFRRMQYRENHIFQDNKDDKYSMPYIVTDKNKGNADSLSIKEANLGTNDSLPPGIINQGKIQDHLTTKESSESKNYTEHLGKIAIDCLAFENLPAPDIFGDAQLKRQAPEYNKEITHQKFSPAASEIFEKRELGDVQCFGKTSLFHPGSHDKMTEERVALEKGPKEQRTHEKDIKELEAESGQISESSYNEEHKFPSTLHVKLARKKKIRKKKAEFYNAKSPAILAEQLPDNLKEPRKGADISIGQKNSSSSIQNYSNDDFQLAIGENPVSGDSGRSSDVFLYPELQKNYNNENNKNHISLVDNSMLAPNFVATNLEEEKTLSKLINLMGQNERDKDKYTETSITEPAYEEEQYIHHIYNEPTSKHDESIKSDEKNQGTQVENISCHFLDHEIVEDPRNFGENDGLASDTLKHRCENENNENSHDVYDTALNLKAPDLGRAKIHEIIRQKGRKELTNERSTGIGEVLEPDKEIQTQVKIKELLELDQCNNKLEIGPRNVGDTDRAGKDCLEHGSLGFEEIHLKDLPNFDKKIEQRVQIPVSPNIVSVDESKNESLQKLQKVIELEDVISTDSAVIDQKTGQDTVELACFEKIHDNVPLASNFKSLGSEDKVEILTSPFASKDLSKNDSMEGIVTYDLAYEKSQENVKGVGQKYNYSPEKSSLDNRLTGMVSVSKEKDQLENFGKFSQDNDKKILCDIDSDHQGSVLIVAPGKNHHQQHLSDSTEPLCVFTGSIDKAIGASNSTKLKNDSTSSENCKLSSELINMKTTPCEENLRPPVDPEYGDLLLLPPLNSKPLDSQHEDDLPKLPESRPDTPENSNLDDRSQNSPRNSGIQASPARLLSQSSIPISLHFGKRANQMPKNLDPPKTLHPNISLYPSQKNSLQVSRPRTRHASWDRATEFQPLYLLEINKQNLVWNNEVENLPKLPESPRRSRSSSQVDLNRKTWCDKQKSSDIMLSYPRAKYLPSSKSLHFDESIVVQTEEINKSEGHSNSSIRDDSTGSDNLAILSPSSFGENKPHQADQLRSNLSSSILIQSSGDPTNKKDNSTQLIHKSSDANLLETQNINDELRNQTNLVSEKNIEITAIIPETNNETLSTSKYEKILDNGGLSNPHKELKNENEVTKSFRINDNHKDVTHFLEEKSKNQLNKEEAGSMSIYNQRSLTCLEQDLTEPGINVNTNIDNYENTAPEAYTGNELNTNTETQVDTQHDFNLITVAKTDVNSSVLDIKNLSPGICDYHKVYESQPKLSIMVIPERSRKKELAGSLPNQDIDKEENNSIVSENFCKSDYLEGSLITIHTSDVLEINNTSEKNCYATMSDKSHEGTTHGLKIYDVESEIVEPSKYESIYEKEDKKSDRAQQEKIGEVDPRENQIQKEKEVDPSELKKSPRDNQLENYLISDNNLAADNDEKQLDIGVNEVFSTQVNIENYIHGHISDATEYIMTDKNCIADNNTENFKIGRLDNMEENEVSKEKKFNDSTLMQEKSFLLNSNDKVISEKKIFFMGERMIKVEKGAETEPVKKPEMELVKDDEVVIEKEIKKEIDKVVEKEVEK